MSGLGAETIRRRRGAVLVRHALFCVARDVLAPGCGSSSAGSTSFPDGRATDQHELPAPCVRCDDVLLLRSSVLRARALPPRRAASVLRRRRSDLRRARRVSLSRRTYSVRCGIIPSACECLPNESGSYSLDTEVNQCRPATRHLPCATSHCRSAVRPKGQRLSPSGSRFASNALRSSPSGYRLLPCRARFLLHGSPTRPNPSPLRAGRRACRPDGCALRSKCAGPLSGVSTPAHPVSRYLSKLCGHVTSVLNFVLDSHRNVLGCLFGAPGCSRDGLPTSPDVRQPFSAPSRMCARDYPASSAPSTVGVDASPPATSRPSLVPGCARDHLQLAVERVDHHNRRRISAPRWRTD